MFSATFRKLVRPIGVAALSLALTTGASAHEPQDGYWIEDIGDLGGNWTRPHGISGQGRVAGRSKDASGTILPMYWSKSGGMVNMGFVAGYPYSSPKEQLDSGTHPVSGWLANNVNTSQATEFRSFVFHPTPNGFPQGYTVLPTLGGTFSKTYEGGMNEQMQVVGESTLATGEVRGFVWLPYPAYGLASGVHDLGTVANGLSSKAWAISSNGLIAGETTDSNGIMFPTLWSPNLTGPGFNMTTYALPSGATYIAKFFSTNAAGTSVGAFLNTNNEFRPLRSQGTATVELPLPQGFNRATAREVNSFDIAVGDETDSVANGRGIVWNLNTNASYELDSLIAYRPNPQVRVSFTNSIADSGEIVSWGYDGSTNRGLILHPIDPALAITPTTAPVNSTVNFSLEGGAPGMPALFVISRWNGMPSFAILLPAAFDSAGKININLTVPPGLTGSTVHFAAITLGVGPNLNILTTQEVPVYFS